MMVYFLLRNFSLEEPEDCILNMVHNNSQWITDDGVAWDLGQDAYIQKDADGYPTTMTPLPGGTFTRVKILMNRSRKLVNV